MTTRQKLEWRRSKVLEYLAQGLNQSQIAERLQLSRSVISDDVIALRKLSKERIKTHIEQRLPLEFEKSLTTLEQLKFRAWDIMEKAEDPRIKLQAIDSIMACTGQTMDLLSHSSIIESSLHFVDSANSKLDSIAAKITAASEGENSKKVDEIQNDERVTTDNDLSRLAENHSTEGATAAAVSDDRHKEAVF